jgi:nucleoside-diphosphate-sugar epimerase
MQDISKNPKILILGSTGYVGSNLKKIIKKEFLLKSINYKKKDKDTLFLNLQNTKEKIQKINKFSPEVIINSSWYGIPIFNKKNCQKSIADAILFMKIMKKIKSCKKIIFLGSCAEYKSERKKISLRETSKNLNQTDNLGIYKNKLRRIIFKKFSKDFNILWLRLFYVFGRNQKSHTLLKILQTKKKQIEINTPYSYIDFIHIDDVAKLIKKFVLSNIKSGIYNVGTGKGFQIKKVCEKYKKKNLKIIYNYANNSKKYIIANTFKTSKCLKIKKMKYMNIIN